MAGRNFALLVVVFAVCSTTARSEIPGVAFERGSGVGRKLLRSLRFDRASLAPLFEPHRLPQPYPTPDPHPLRSMDSPVQQPDYKDPCPKGFVNVVVNMFTECLFSGDKRCPLGQLSARTEYRGPEKCYPDPAASPVPVRSKNADPCPSGWVNAVVGSSVKCVVSSWMPCPEGQVSAWIADGGHCLPDPLSTDLALLEPEPQPVPKPPTESLAEPASPVQQPDPKDACPEGFAYVEVDGFAECLFSGEKRCPPGQLSARTEYRGAEKCYPDPAASTDPVPTKDGDPCPSGYVYAVVGSSVKCVVRGSTPCPEGQVSAWIADGGHCLPHPAAQVGVQPHPLSNRAKVAPVDPLPDADKNSTDVVVTLSTTPNDE